MSAKRERDDKEHSDEESPPIKPHEATDEPDAAQPAPEKRAKHASVAIVITGSGGVRFATVDTKAEDGTTISSESNMLEPVKDTHFVSYVRDDDAGTITAVLGGRKREVDIGGGGTVNSGNARITQMFKSHRAARTAGSARALSVSAPATFTPVELDRTPKSLKGVVFKSIAVLDAAKVTIAEPIQLDTSDAVFITASEKGEIDVRERTWPPGVHWLEVLTKGKSRVGLAGYTCVAADDQDRYQLTIVSDGDSKVLDVSAADNVRISTEMHATVVVYKIRGYLQAMARDYSNIRVTLETGAPKERTRKEKDATLAVKRAEPPNKSVTDTLALYENFTPPI